MPEAFLLPPILKAIQAEFAKAWGLGLVLEDRPTVPQKPCLPGYSPLTPPSLPFHPNIPSEEAFSSRCLVLYGDLLLSNHWCLLPNNSQGLRDIISVSIFSFPPLSIYI